VLSVPWLALVWIWVGCSCDVVQLPVLGSGLGMDLFCDRGCWFVGVFYWVAKFYLTPSALQKLRNMCVASFEVVVSVRKSR